MKSLKHDQKTQWILRSVLLGFEGRRSFRRWCSMTVWIEKVLIRSFVSKTRVSDGFLDSTYVLFLSSLVKHLRLVTEGVWAVDQSIQALTTLQDGFYCFVLYMRSIPRRRRMTVDKTQIKKSHRVSFMIIFLRGRSKWNRWKQDIYQNDFSFI